MKIVPKSQTTQTIVEPRESYSTLINKVAYAAALSALLRQASGERRQGIIDAAIAAEMVIVEMERE